MKVYPYVNLINAVIILTSWCGCITEHLHVAERLEKWFQTIGPRNGKKSSKFSQGKAMFLLQKTWGCYGEHSHPYPQVHLITSDLSLRMPCNWTWIQVLKGERYQSMTNSLCTLVSSAAFSWWQWPWESHLGFVRLCTEGECSTGKGCL